MTTYSAQWNQLILADIRRVLREPLFIFLLVAPFLLAIGLRILLPYLAGEFQDIDLASYYPLIIVLFVMVSPLYYGVILGLQVLEEKDENVLLAVAVTPLRLRTYLAARILLFTLISLPIIVFVHQIIAVIDVSMAKLVWIALATSLNTPLVVMLLAAFAKNQLEGFVIGKGLGFLILFPMAMFFVPDYWHLICGVLPTYWPVIAYYTAAEGGSNGFFIISILMSFLVQGFFIVILYRKFAGELALA